MHNKSFSEIFRQESRKWLEEVKSQRGTGLADIIRRYAPDGTILQKAPERTPRPPMSLNVMPEANQINYHQTTDEMILNDEAVLNDGRYVTWPSD